MKKALCFIILWGVWYNASGQGLHIDSTRFIGGASSCGYTNMRYSIATKDGGILFVGETNCFAGGEDIPPNFPDTGADYCGNVLIGKMDRNMQINWIKIYGGSSCDVATSAVQTADGGYAVLAYTGSNDNDVSGNHGSEDIWLIRIDSAGHLLWQKCYGSPYSEQSGSIALTPDNGFIFYGVSNGYGGDVPTHYSGSQFDGDWIVVKTDSAGNKQWSKSIGGQGDEETYGNILSENGGYYLVSSSNSTDYDCNDTLWHPGLHSTAYNYFIFRIDYGGNILWDSSYGGSWGEIVYNAIWDKRDSSIVMNGVTTSTDYMVNGNHGGIDMWTIKTDKNGVLKWSKCFGTANDENDDSGCGILATSFGYMCYGNTAPGNIGHSDGWIFALTNTGDSIISKQFGGTGYEWVNCILPFRNGYAATGSSNSDNFTEGVNIGHPPELISDAFISYVNFWPLITNNVDPTDKQLTIYPNPARDEVVLWNAAGCRLRIYSIQGLQVMEAALTTDRQAIDIRKLVPGVYITEIISGTTMQRQAIRLVVE